MQYIVQFLTKLYSLKSISIVLTNGKFWAALTANTSHITMAMELLEIVSAWEGTREEFMHTNLTLLDMFIKVL